MTSSITRYGTALALGTVLLVWSGLGAQPAVAQKKASIRMTRLYSGPNGVSLFEDLDMASSPVPTGEQSEMMKVAGAQFARMSLGTFFDWHPEPQRQYVIPLQGQLEVEVSGSKMTFGPGHILLAEDLTGKGHISRVVGTGDCVVIIVPLAAR